MPSLQLVLEAGVGIAVLVRCFVNKTSMEAEIIDRLGNGFSHAPFATVVVDFQTSCLKSVILLSFSLSLYCTIVLIMLGSGYEVVSINCLI